MIYAFGGPSRISSCAVSHSSVHGIFIAGVPVEVFGNQIATNQGIGLVSGGSPLILRSNLFAGNGIGVWNLAASPVIDARYNSWGSSSGPRHASNPNGTGDVVGDYVLFDPWGHSFVDLDLDGLPDEWEVEFFGSIQAAGPDQDSDGDGATNFEEWLAGTNPTNAASRFQLTLSPNLSDPLRGLVLQWPSVPNRNYTVLWSPQIGLPFQVIATNLPASPPLNTYADVLHQDHSSGFYRIIVRANE